MDTVQLMLYMPTCVSALIIACFIFDCKYDAIRERKHWYFHSSGFFFFSLVLNALKAFSSYVTIQQPAYGILAGKGAVTELQ